MSQVAIPMLFSSGPAYLKSKQSFVVAVENGRNTCMQLESAMILSISCEVARNVHDKCVIKPLHQTFKLSLIYDLAKFCDKSQLSLRSD